MPDLLQVTEIQVNDSETSDKFKPLSTELNKTPETTDATDLPLQKSNLTEISDIIKGGSEWGSTCRLSVKISVLCRLSVKIFVLCR